MNQKEIRDTCFKCGHRCLLLMESAPIGTDYCEKAQVACSEIKYCDPSIRIPKNGQVKYKKAVKDV